MTPCVPLILGAGGMLGRALAARLERSFPATITATRAEADITDRFRLEADVERLQPTVIVNCAAWTDVDACEADAGKARAVNAAGAENVARVARAAGCRLIHLSTDLVFDGRAGRPYTETDAPAPLSAYGRSKLEGERRALDAGGSVLVVRSAWLFGPGRSNFVDSVRRRLASGEAVPVVSDQAGSPTRAGDLAEALERLLTLEAEGILHVVNAGACTRLELAQAIAHLIGADTSKVRSITAAASGRAAPRPEYAVLDAGRHAALAGAPLRSWQQALRAHLAAPGGA